MACQWTLIGQKDVFRNLHCNVKVLKYTDI